MFLTHTSTRVWKATQELLTGTVQTVLTVQLQEQGEARSMEEQELRLLQEGNRRAVIWIPGGLERQVTHNSSAAPGIPLTLGKAVSPCSFQKF